MKSSESIAEIATALSKAQAQMGGAHKGAANPFFKSSYADLGSVIEAIKAPFAANGLSFVQFPSMAEGMVTVTTRLMHGSGEWLEDTLCLPLAKNDAQAVGSAISYGRRYSLQSIAGIPSVDDDGESAMDRSAPPPKTIGRNQVEQLLAAIEATGTDLAKVCKAYNVESLDSMTEQQHQNALRLLQKKGEGK